jgi:hypothetical protein
MPKGERRKFDELETQLRSMCDTVDRFYDTLGPRNWIFHEYLPVDDIKGWLDDGTTEAVEEKLITYYQNRDTLERNVQLACRSLPAMHRRLPLIQLAMDDYFAERHYSTVHLLLSVMDGFVNEFETVRRGLHAREIEELDASNTVVAHHMGLAKAHTTFRRAKSKTTDEPVFELYRNGIVHGSILNYNNEIVASKAWNRLFAVADWAMAREKEKIPAKAKPTWRELFTGLVDLDRHRKALDAWQPQALHTGDEDLENHPAYLACHDFLILWRRKNYKGMSELISHTAHKTYPKQMIVKVRQRYERRTLGEFEIVEVHNSAPAVCEVTVNVTVEGAKRVARMRWLHEDEDGHTVSASLPADWRLSVWWPATFLSDR